MTVLQPKLLGSPIKRREDPKLITGSSSYVDDIKLVGTAYLVVLRSPYGHARIKSIDTSAARSAPGVLDVVTAADVNGLLTSPLPVIIPLAKFDDAKAPERRVFATDKVRFVGDPVAAVVAESRAAARDAASLIEVDYEPLDAVIDPEAAMAESAPILHEQFG